MNTEREMRRIWLLVAGIVAVVLAVFWSASYGEFLLWDDDINITGNSNVRGLRGENLAWMFTNLDYMRRYVPLTWLNWAIDYELFGLTARSAHVGNILFHGANTLLVFAIVRRVLRAWRTKTDMPAASYAAAIGSLWWALHPLRVEVVAWASGRIYCQTAFFLLLAAFSYLRAMDARARRPRAWFMVSVGAFALSMLSYPLGITFVGVLVVADVWLFKRWPHGLRGWRERGARQSAWMKIPYVLVAVGVLSVTLLARFGAGGMWDRPPNLEEFGLGARIMQAFYVEAIYLWKTLMPLNLAPTYTALISFSPLDAKFILSAIAVLGITAVLVWKRERWPGWLALWLCHLILIAPFLGLTEHPHYPNDRYSYLQGVIVAVLVSTGTLPLLQRGYALTTLATAGAAVTVCALLTFAQIHVWRSSEILFRHIIAMLGEHPYRADLQVRLGNVLIGKQRFAEATKLFRAAIEVGDPASSSLAYVGLGQIARNEGRRREALTFYRKAGEMDPGQYYAYAESGALLVEDGQPQAARSLLKRATELRPNFAHAYFLLGLAYSRVGQQEDARVAFEAAVLRDPGSADARASLAITLNLLERHAEAIRHAEAAVRLAPDVGTLHAILGDALSAAGRKAEAIEAWRQAVKRDPNQKLVHYMLGRHFATAGETDAALQHFEAAIRTDPNFAEAHLNRGVLLQAVGRNSEAAEALNAALRINPDLSAARQALQRLRK